MLTMFVNHVNDVNLCVVVEDVRTIFEAKNDATIYIPTFYPTTHRFGISDLIKLAFNV